VVHLSRAIVEWARKSARYRAWGEARGDLGAAPTVIETKKAHLMNILYVFSRSLAMHCVGKMYLASSTTF